MKEKLKLRGAKGSKGAGRHSLLPGQRRRQARRKGCARHVLPIATAAIWVKVTVLRACWFQCPSIQRGSAAPGARLSWLGWGVQ